MEAVEDGGELPHGAEPSPWQLRRKRGLDDRGDHHPSLLPLLLLSTAAERSGSCRRVGSRSSGGRVGGQGLAVVFQEGGSVRGWRGREIIGHGGKKCSEGTRSTGRSRGEARAAGGDGSSGEEERRRRDGEEAVAIRE